MLDRSASNPRKDNGGEYNESHDTESEQSCKEQEAHRARLPGALTFELSGRQRQDARPGLAKMYRVPPDRAWWPAVGAPLERGVRRQFGQAQLR